LKGSVEKISRSWSSTDKVNLLLMLIHCWRLSTCCWCWSTVEDYLLELRLCRWTDWVGLNHLQLLLSSYVFVYIFSL
jgi:hypothetical protein